MNQLRSITIMICLLVAASLSGSSEHYNDVLMDRYKQSFLTEQTQSEKNEMQLTSRPRQRTGEWRYFESGRYCDGYLTDAYNQDFCESDPPDDWDTFRFDGEIYFAQRLSETVRN